MIMIKIELKQIIDALDTEIWSNREKKIMRLRYIEKQTLQNIAVKFAVTRERIRQIEHKSLRKLHYKAKWDSGLSCRVRNILAGEKITNEKELWLMAKKGLLNPKIFRARNYGKKSYEEICKFLNMPELLTYKKTCPPTKKKGKENVRRNSPKTD